MWTCRPRLQVRGLLQEASLPLLPRTRILKELSVYTTDPEQRAPLKLMASTTGEGKALYQSWVVDSCRHIAHILEDMDNCKPPIDHILELLPRMKRRFYSIASSAKVEV